MIQSKDYKAYIYDSNDILNILKKTNSVLQYRIEDVKKVLDHICNLERIKKDISEELTIIFETGFSYIHETLETIKIYYDKYLNKSTNLLQKYDKAINYILFLDDYLESLKEKKLLTQEFKTKCERIIEELEKIIQEKKEFNEELLDGFNNLLDEDISSLPDVLTTDHIFSLILEELRC